ncbi:hypothetical protein D3C85_1882020 [compost metagenome]
MMLNSVPSSVSSRVCPNPDSTAGAKNHSANTPHSQRSLAATDWTMAARIKTENSAPTSRSG